MVIVPATGDLFLQEDSAGEQFVCGLTPGGEVFDFARSITNDTEFCGGCFSPDGEIFFLNQQGERGGAAGDESGLGRTGHNLRNNGPVPGPPGPEEQPGPRFGAW